ncbi:MAG: hypothetical protein KDF95_15365 [Rhodocyclaceae bacterium]|nr:hypothetical protein [Rhodocyclaceae bacterium]
MKDFDAFLAGRGRLAGLMHALPPFEPPPGMEARFVAALPATPAADGQFEPPPSLAEAVLAEAARLDTAQRPRQQAVLDEMIRAGADQALGTALSDAGRDWLQGRRAPEATRAPRPTRRRFGFAPLAGMLAATVALGVALQVMRQQPAEFVPTAPVADALQSPPAMPAAAAKGTDDTESEVAASSSLREAVPAPAPVTPAAAPVTAQPRAARKAEAPASVQPERRLRAEKRADTPPPPRVAAPLARAPAAPGPAPALPPLDQAVAASPPPPPAAAAAAAQAPAPEPTSMLAPQRPAAEIASPTGIAAEAGASALADGLRPFGRQRLGTAAKPGAGARFALSTDPAEIARRLTQIAPDAQRWLLTTSDIDLEPAHRLARRIEALMLAAGREIAIEVAAGDEASGQAKFSRREPVKRGADALP